MSFEVSRWSTGSRQSSSSKADTKAAQIFTLAHELAHVALGGSAISSPDLAHLDDGNETERWCNQVAAELLVPVASIRDEFIESISTMTAELDRLAKFYKVSTLVVLRRIFDAELIPQRQFRAAYRDELERVLAIAADQRLTEARAATLTTLSRSGLASVSLVP